MAVSTTCYLRISSSPGAKHLGW